MWRTVLGLLPIPALESALAAYDRWGPILEENQHAVAAASAVLDAGHGPLAAARAFAQATTTPLDDDVVAELEHIIRVMLRASVVAVDVIGRVAVALDDARVDAARRTIIDVGYALAAQRHQLATWLDE